MQTISVRELQQNLGLYLEKVKDGDEIIVADENKIIARILPFETEEERLVADNLMSLPKSELPGYFWETDAPEVLQEKIIEIIRSERDKD